MKNDNMINFCNTYFIMNRTNFQIWKSIIHNKIKWNLLKRYQKQENKYEPNNKLIIYSKFWPEMLFLERGKVVIRTVTQTCFKSKNFKKFIKFE